MGSSWVLLCSTALVLVFLSSASKDERITEQREVTFDIDKIMQEMQQPDPFVMQKEVDLADLLDSEDFNIEQRIVSPPDFFQRETGGSAPRASPPRGRQPSFGPRSFPPMDNYLVQFPLSRPTSDNLQAICLHGEHRPRYPVSYFPASGYGQQRRRASAVNNAESWFATCCKGNQTWEREVTLCCATQAWELSVKSFCEEDSSVKDLLYHCCKLSGGDRLNCFNNDAQNPNYEATEPLPVLPVPSTYNFSFDPNTCQRTVMTPYSVRASRRSKPKKPSTSQKIDINFPPGRPTADTYKSLCRHQNLRPLYNIKCLSGEGYGWLARQAKTVNRMEKGFRKCCKRKTSLTCLVQKWRAGLNKFCKAANGEQVDFPCCSRETPDDRFSCFKSLAPDPYYNMTSDVSINNMCDTHSIIKKRGLLGFPLKNFVSKCCHLSAEEKTVCIGQELVEMPQRLCGTKTTPRAARRCCKMSSNDPMQCISSIIMEAVTKATTILHQKKKCPIS